MHEIAYKISKSWGNYIFNDFENLDINLKFPHFYFGQKIGKINPYFICK